MSQTAGDKTEQTQPEICALHQEIGVGLQTIPMDQNGFEECVKGVLSGTTTNQGNQFSC